MGLGVYIDAPLKKLRHKLRTLEDVERAARNAIADPQLARFTRAVRENETEVGLWLHPAGEPLFFELQKGTLVASCKTSTAGPGYHAYVVELLERMGHCESLDWRWKDNEGEDGDECGYHESRDFEKLQWEMLGWLRQLAKTAMSEDFDDDNLLLSLPIGFHPVRSDKICSPMGVWDPAWLREVAEAGDSRLGEIGPSFFAWWNCGCDADFWSRYGQALCWTEIPWRPPMSDGEREIYDKASDAFETSRRLDASIMLPDLEIAELRALRDARQEDAKPPRQMGLGFKRGDMAWSISAGWTLQAPGYWFNDVDDGYLVLWFGGRTIRTCSFTVKGVRDRDLLASSTKSHKWDSDDQLVRWESEHLFAQGVIRWTNDDGGYWMLQGCVASQDKLCVVTLCFNDDIDRAWAEEMFRTLKRPPT